jgi:hypothetical protein
MPDRYALTEIPYNLDDIKLGSLVPNIAQPDQDFFPPAGRLRAGTDFKSRNQKNFKFSLEQDNNTSGKLRLTRLFTTSGTSRDEDKAELWSKEGRAYSLTQPKQLFNSMCRSTRTQHWMQATLDDGLDIHLVVGLRTFLDATTSDEKGTTRNIDANLTIPVGELAAGVSTGDALDVGLDVSEGTKEKETESFEVPGERIFAVCTVK